MGDQIKKLCTHPIRNRRWAPLFSAEEPESGLKFEGSHLALAAGTKEMTWKALSMLDKIEKICVVGNGPLSDDDRLNINDDNKCPIVTRFNDIYQMNHFI